MKNVNAENVLKLTLDLIVNGRKSYFMYIS